MSVVRYLGRPEVPATGLAEDQPAAGLQDTDHLADGPLRIDERIETVSREIAAADPNCRTVMSIPGIGPMIPTAMVAATATGDGFDRGRDFSVRVGSSPDSTSRAAAPSWGGSRSAAAAICECFLSRPQKVIMMRPRRWADFRFGAWLTRAAERVHRNKLGVALANKLTRMAWSVLRHGMRFDERVEAAMAV
jgi:transposase